MSISNNKATVTLKNGQKEGYDLSKPEQKAKFEKKYGEFVPPVPPLPAKMEIMEVPVKISSPTILDNLLIIVDGVIVNKGELDNLNPNSIASMEVLKTKAATAAYGEKGRNGVIIIKTKTNENAKPITQMPFLFPVVKNDGF